MVLGMNRWWILIIYINEFVQKQKVLMNKIGNNLYTNFPARFQSTFQSTEKIRTLVMGHCGNGKTHFINNLCHTSHRTGIKKGSLTRDITVEDVATYPPGVFSIYDTPGTNSTKNAVEGALILRKSLTMIPLNLVMIQSKFDSRFEDSSLTELKKHIKIFKGYTKNIIFLISHIDILDSKPDQERQEVLSDFYECLQENNIKQKIILYSNLNSDHTILSKILYSIGRSQPQINIKIEDPDFFKHFKLTDMNLDLQEDMINQYVQVIKEEAAVYIQCLDRISRDQQAIDDLISDLKTDMKIQLKNLQTEQYKEYLEKLSEAQTCDLYLLISQIILSKLQYFDQRSELKLKKRYYYEGDKKQYDIRDMFKQCPQCLKIWMRSQGCGGGTYCGKKPSFFDFWKQKSLFRFQFFRKGNQLYFKKREEVRKTEKDIKKNYDQQKKRYTDKKSQCETQKETSSLLFPEQLCEQKQQWKEGCGFKMNWSELPRLPNIDEIVRNLYGICNYSEMKADFKMLGKKRQNYEKNINNKVQENQKTINKSLRQ